MHNLKSIRRRLRLTQQEVADSLGCTQGNVGHYERGQTLPPEMARKLITFAATRGLAIGFDHVYGDARLPGPQSGACESDNSQGSEAVHASNVGAGSASVHQNAAEVL